LQGNWRVGGGGKFRALTLPRVFLVKKIDWGRGRGQNREKNGVIGKKKKNEKGGVGELGGDWGGGGGGELTALTLPRVFLVIKIDCRKGRVLNSEEIRVIGNK